MLTAINMGAEYNPVIANLAQAGQAKYLVATAISKNSPVPAHKFM